MNRKNIVPFLLCCLLLLNCSSLTRPLWPTATPTVTPTETPRPVPAFETYSEVFPLDWPLQRLSEKQVDEAKACDLEKLAADRYPTQHAADKLPGLFEPATACDWAVLAFAYAERTEDDQQLSAAAKNAFAKAIARNLGFAFSTPLYYRFFDAFPIVKAPPVAEQATTEVQIDYKWSGLGEDVQYKVDIRDADTTPVIVVTGYKATADLKKTVDKKLVQALGGSLSDLLPVEHQISLVACYDNYPEWTVTLTQKDGTRLVLETNGSNMLYIGGPWQTEIDGQNYLQFSSGFPKALNKLVQEIGLKYGEWAAMSCFPRPVLEQVYP